MWECVSEFRSFELTQMAQWRVSLLLRNKWAPSLNTKQMSHARNRRAEISVSRIQYRRNSHIHITNWSNKSEPASNYCVQVATDGEVVFSRGYETLADKHSNLSFARENFSLAALQALFQTDGTTRESPFSLLFFHSLRYHIIPLLAPMKQLSMPGYDRNQ